MKAVLRALSSSAAETADYAAAVAGLAAPGDIIVLAGDLGTGKTVWVQGFARGLGVIEQVTSPTFTLVRPYLGSSLQLLHADVYRLDTLGDVVDLGIIEQLDGRPAGTGLAGSVACIEWGDLTVPVLPPDFLEVRIADGASETERHIDARVVGPRWADRFERLQSALGPWMKGLEA